MIEMIESTQNQRVKYVRKLQSNRRFRNSEGCFVIEGSKWLHEFSVFQDNLTAVYYTDHWLANEQNQLLLHTFNTEKFAVSETVLNAMSATQTPSGVIATARKPTIALPTTIEFILILDSIADPGNLGTIIRTAAAAGVQGVILSPDCVDLYNPKVVRSSMGALLKVPIEQKSWAEIKALCQRLPVYALDANGKTLYSQVDWTKPAVLMVGNEGHGLSNEGRAIASSILSIPMQNAVESLNASMAIGIVLFEAVRQKNK